MTTDSLGEFLEGRVLATRQMHHMQIPVEMDSPAVGIMLDSSEDGIAIVVLPTVVHDVVHLEVHHFVDGERQNPDVVIPTETAGVIEITLRRQNVPN